MRRAALLFVFVFSAGACSVVVDFKDPIDAEEIVEAGAVESGAIVPEAGAPNDSGGPITNDVAVPDDAAVAPDTTPPPFTCEGKPDGTPVPNTASRCCGYAITQMGTNANCGGCGIACNTAQGHNCVNRDGHYYCAGCANDGGGGNNGCWTSCCTKPFFSPDGICAPELPCGVPIPICDDGACEAHGAGCHTSALGGTYCE